jgi:hypothetical protein
MDEEQPKEWILKRLKHSLQALALAAPAQLSLFPDCVKTDELVLDFDHWRLCAVGNYQCELTAAQFATLSSIDAHIESPPTAAVWVESGLYSHPFWEELRTLARQSLAAFGWPEETPPGYAHEFVRVKRGS